MVLFLTPYPYPSSDIVSTGALLSPTSTLQKQTIPCVAHAVVIEND